MNKIGIDCRLWSESGVGRYIRNLVNQLAQIDRHNQYTLFFRKKEFEEVALPGKNFEKKVVDIRWHTIAEQFKFPSILNQKNFDLVHFPYFSVPIFYNRPFVVTIHDLILHHYPTGEASTLPLPLYRLKYLGYQFIIRQVARKAKNIITVSESTRKEIIKYLHVKENKITVTLEGIDSAIISISNNKTLVKEPYFLHIGNVYPHKNTDRLLQAFQKVISTHNGVKLIFVGKKDFFFSKLIQNINKNSMTNEVLYIGEVSDSELASLYKSALALITCSLMEGFDLPLLEALANKCLILASDIPVHHEITQDNALFFNPYDVENIVEKMKNVLDSGNAGRYSEMKKKGILRSEQFSWRDMAARTLNIYESCFSATSV